MDLETTDSHSDETSALRERIASLEARIAELEQERHELRMSVEQSQALVAAVAKMSWSTNADGSTGLASMQWCEFTGQTVDELQGVGWAEALHPEDRAHAAMAWQNAVATRSVYNVEFRLRRRDGVYHQFWSVGVPHVLEDGSIRKWIGCCVDVTEQRHTERALRVSEERYRSITMRLPVAVFETDAEGKTKFVNDTWTTVTGVPASQAAGDGWVRGLHRDDVNRVVESWLEVVKTGEQKHPLDFRFHLPDGTIRWVSARAEAMRRADGAIEGFLGTLTDINDRKQAEELLRETMEQKEIIEAQRQRLADLSTPLIPITDRILTMPLVGALDPERAEQVLTTLLEGVSRTGAAVAILDITGVAVVDTQVASALLRAAQAVRLLGAEVILSGIRAEVAQTLVGLGAEFGGLITTGSLKLGIDRAMKAVSRRG
ncbi:PAS domain-containing protein [Polyangium sp. y55x31]|uniref:PAS domain-containing protein n=1 Tax=Polyangium sp. y55x31 TaxID=3042688 RepID=UPI00248302CB|nr:PAS domain-containing protein [Polyangium sp. y55x31]MDI1478892.1 PAS domain-containing protein [Polyangium sp. y55x31]